MNVAAFLPEMARRQPDEWAIVWSRGTGYEAWSFRKLNEETDRIAHGLVQVGLARGMRTILMVRPSAQFFALTFALYKIGAVPVLVDPGMGRLRMVECLAAVKAEAFIGIPPAHLLRLFHPESFATLRIIMTVGRSWGWGGHRLNDLRDRAPARPFDMASTRADDPAAIIFTTGSTGPPKGVLYRHGMFDAQVRALREHFGIQPGEIDLPTFPLFALFDPALGMTAVIPEMDFTRPGWVDPMKIIRAIQDQRVTHLFGSPALLDRVGRFGEARGIKLPSLRRVVSAGAAVPPATMRRFGAMLSEGVEVHTPCGATEALPVTSIGSREVLGETAARTEGGAGTCVGRPMPGVTVRIIRIVDEPIETWRHDLAVPEGEIGEIVVKGEVVTREYVTDGAASAIGDVNDGAVATRLAKIHEGADIWHRMGDVGYFDAEGRIWFSGRKSHRVVTERGTVFTEPYEAIFNGHPAVFRSALVGVGARPRQRPVVCIELEPELRRVDRAALSRELVRMAEAHDITRVLNTFLFHPRFPVDIRHNAKIFREKLAAWAAERLA